MNRNDFLRMIEQSGPSDRHMIGEVSELIKIFPYFQSAYILMLKGLRNTSDVRFENQLKISAMHIADREVLYYFLKRETEAEVKPETEITVTPRIVEGDTTEIQQTVIESAKNSADLISVYEKNPGEYLIRQPSEGLQSSAHTVLITTESDNDESTASVLIIDEESGAIEEKVTYMDPGFSVTPATELLELESEETALSEISSDDTHTGQISPEISETKRQLQSDLIDKFINANPRIEPVRTKTDAPVEDISKPFVEEKEGFVTETLARIYINQGYYSRAIDIYERLSLKFPEKSSYFASQIEKVKELIK